MFAVTFVGVFFRSTQQRHVMAAQYWRMPPISFGMAYCDIFLTANIAYKSTEILPLIIAGFAMGCGGSLGSMMGTYLHKRRHG